MKPLFSGLNFFFLYILSHGAAANKLIHDTCKESALKDPNLSYEFCVNSLESAPHSHWTNLHELGMASIKLIRNNATDTRIYTKELLKNEELDQFVKVCLADCFDLYSDAIPTLKQAAKDYNSKHYVDANIKVGSIMDASSTCEDGFEEKEGVVSPLKKRNNDVFQLSAIALSIIKMLQ